MVKKNHTEAKIEFSSKGKKRGMELKKQRRRGGKYWSYLKGSGCWESTGQ